MTENKPIRTELSELGEFGLIKHLTENIKLVNDSSINGVGDDAAVLNFKEKHVVVSTDMLIEGVHFDLSYVPLKHLGYKAVSVNLSDIYAMNAMPKQITLSIAVSNRFSLEAIEEFYSGVYLACERHGVDLVGGDTSSSQLGFVVSITAIGEADKEDIAYRSGAKENDLLCVSGDLGAAYIGLQLLEREKSVFKENPNIQPDLQGHDYILQRQLKPEARKDIIKLLKELGIKPTSMIDISDGLASETMHLCNSSGVGCSLYEEKIPIDTATTMMAEEFNISPYTCALNGGEDYELLFTVPLSAFDILKSNKKISIIGHITNKAEGCNLLTQSGQSFALKAQGWDSLLKN
jgi:thiamine-monophosphate kinase